MPKKTVALVGFAETTRSLAPFDDPDVTIWGCNHVYQVAPRVDALFELHSPRMLADHYGPHWKQYQEDLASGKWPIYMQKAYEDFPTAIRYPIEKVAERFSSLEIIIEGDTRQDRKRLISKSTPSYMLALATIEGFERIEIYGIDMYAGTEWDTQRPDFMRYVGRAEALGIEVAIPERSALLKEDGYSLYAYEEVAPEIDPVIHYLRHNMAAYAKRFSELDTATDTLRRQLQGWSAILDELESFDTLPSVNGMKDEFERRKATYRKQLEEKQVVLDRLLSEMNKVDGAHQQAKALVEWLCYGKGRIARMDGAK